MEKIENRYFNRNESNSFHLYLSNVLITIKTRLICAKKNVLRSSYMSNTPKPLRFVYGRCRIVTPDVESCVNIPEVERHAREQ